MVTNLKTQKNMREKMWTGYGTQQISKIYKHDSLITVNETNVIVLM